MPDLTGDGLTTERPALLADVSSFRNGGFQEND